MTWLKLYRQLRDHKLWLDEPFTRGQAWVDLLILANWKPATARIRGIKVSIERGQVLASYRFLADRWQWSTGKVERFLNELKTETQIETQKNNLTQVITIINYERYQSDETDNGDTDVTQTGHRRDTDGTTIRRNKNNQEEKRRTKNNPPKSPKGELPTCEEFFHRWNKFAAANPPLATCRELTDDRCKKIRTRLLKPKWFDDFREAVCSLPLGGDGWQPDFDWLIKSQHNVYRILEGAFDWRLKQDPALEKLQKDKRRKAAEQRKVELECQKKADKQDSVKVRNAIDVILPQKAGVEGETVESSLLYG